jgi:hypothetical protein
VPTVFWWDIGNYYSTRFWEPGEYIVDRRWLRLFQPNIPAGTYQPNVGLYTPEDGIRAPVAIDGAPAGDAITLTLILTVEESP